VSFHPNTGLFPFGELALPSCPAFVYSFGLKQDQLLVQPVSLIARDPNSHLVKIKLKKHKPVWLIDASSYIKEYQGNMPPADRPQADWQALFSLAEEAGGQHGVVLARYVEEVTARKP
jgi:hypothetical protein